MKYGITLPLDPAVSKIVFDLLTDESLSVITMTFPSRKIARLALTYPWSRSKSVLLSIIQLDSIAVLREYMTQHYLRNEEICAFIAYYAINNQRVNTLTYLHYDCNYKFTQNNINIAVDDSKKKVYYMFAPIRC